MKSQFRLGIVTTRRRVYDNVAAPICAVLHAVNATVGRLDALLNNGVMTVRKDDAEAYGGFCEVGT